MKNLLILSILAFALVFVQCETFFDGEFLDDISDNVPDVSEILRKEVEESSEEVPEEAPKEVPEQAIKEVPEIEEAPEDEDGFWSGIGKLLKKVEKFIDSLLSSAPENVDPPKNAESSSTIATSLNATEEAEIEESSEEGEESSTKESESSTTPEPDEEESEEDEDDDDDDDEEEEEEDDDEEEE